MIEKLKKLDIILCLLIVLSLNSLRDINFPQAIVALGVFTLISFNKWLDHIKKPDVMLEIKQELDNVKSNMSSIMIKNSTKPPQAMQENKRYF